MDMEKSDSEMMLIKDVGLVEIKDYDVGDIRIGAEALDALTPELWKGMRVFGGETRKEIGYIEDAWKADGWWRVDLKVMMNSRLEVLVDGDGAVTPYGLGLQASKLKPDHVTFISPRKLLHITS